MKKIEAIIKPFQLDALRDALAEVGVQEIVVSDVRCSYSQKGNSSSYLSDDYVIEFLPKIKIEIFLLEKNLSPTIAKLRAIIDSERSTDESFAYTIFSKIFISEVIEA